MRRLVIRSIAAVGAAALLTLGTACSNEREGSTSSDSADGKGFAKDSLIGVALPAKTSENWVLAGDLFSDGLKDAASRPTSSTRAPRPRSPTSRRRSPPW